MPSSKTITQVPLRQALELTCLEPGHYSLEVPRSICFGVVALGGFTVSYMHKGAVHFLETTSSKGHRHVRHTSVEYFRPVLSAPNKTYLKIQVANANKAWTTLHVDAIQNDKVCVTGYLTLTDLLSPGKISCETGWQLSPAAPRAPKLRDLEEDKDSSWVSYRTPFMPGTLRMAHSYMDFHLPVPRPHGLNMADQWIRPGWKDEGLPNGAVWTDDLIHCAVDNSLPIINDLLAPENPNYDKVVKAGLSQRQARAEGRSDEFIGEGLSETEIVQWIGSTLSMSTEIIKPLPEEGVKWLFMRCATKHISNNRMDLEIILMDEHEDLIAVSNHVIQIIPQAQKNARKPKAKI